MNLSTEKKIMNLENRLVATQGERDRVGKMKLEIKFGRIQVLKERVLPRLTVEMGYKG